MIDIENKGHCPAKEELSEYVGLELFDELWAHMQSEYGAMCKIEYSGDKVLLGWNVKFKKGGRTLCTAYPRKKHFHILLVVGPSEKQRTEMILPLLSEEFREVYLGTKEGMGQRWMVFDFYSRTPAFNDVLKIVKIRRNKE